MEDLQQLFLDPPQFSSLPDNGIVDDPRDHCEYKELSNEGRSFLERIEALEELEKGPVYKVPRYSSSSASSLPSHLRKKKPPKQPKITSVKNADGYPLIHCEYEPSEDKTVYRPPGYPQNITDLRKGAGSAHCTSCHLKPCLAKAMRPEIKELAVELVSKQGKSSSRTFDKLLNTQQRKHCNLFKRRYLKKLVPPTCLVSEARHTTDLALLLAAEGAKPVINSPLSQMSGIISREMAKHEGSDSPTRNKKPRGSKPKAIKRPFVVIHNFSDSDDSDNEFEMAISRNNKKWCLWKPPPLKGTPRPARASLATLTTDATTDFSSDSEFEFE